MAKFQKGHKGGPGRPPVLLPALQKALDENKNAVKELIMQYFNMTEVQIQERQLNSNIPFIEKCIAQCFERTANDGDVQKLIMLLQIPLGKIPDEKTEFETTAEERALITAYRKRLEEQDGPIAISTQDP